MKSATRLLKWYDVHGRKLPWRSTTDPYRILVSEVMLQQTQVERVKAYYKSWLKQFPDWRALAKASNADVLRAWAGLGYNRRALALRDIARQVIESGEPKDREGWLKLKGIGPYTSAAIMAFAFKEPVLPIDTNVRRFAGRFLFGKTYPQPEDDKRIEKKSVELLGIERAHDVPQAIFDLSTMYCTKVPDCGACPMRKDCKAASKFLSGRVKTPKQMVKKSKEKIYRNKKHPDRIYRGRILKLVREASRSIRIHSIGEKIDEVYNDQLDRKWLEATIDRLVKDEMIVRTAKTITHI